LIEIARQRSEQEGVSAQFQVGDMETLDLSRCFDAVLFFDCLHHVPAYGETLRRAWVHRHQQTHCQVRVRDPLA
jgi:2-polyprenyl-3-methyl-5-hydroxy-6-metoxy-1,4-benzoquinol methylase